MGKTSNGNCIVRKLSDLQLNTTEEREVVHSNTTESNTPKLGRPGDISVIELIAILWKYKLVIVVCAILATAGGIVYALIASEVFSTSTLFVTKTKNSSTSGSFSQLASLAGIQMSNSGNFDPSSFLDKVIQDQVFLSKLFEKKWYYNQDSMHLDQILEILPDTTVPEWQYKYLVAKFEAIRKNKLITISRDDKTGILTLGVNMPDPQLSYDVIQFALNYLNNYMRNSIQTQAKEKRLFIQERIDESQRDLTNSEDALSRFKERNLMSTSPKVMLEEARLMRKVALNQEIYLQFRKQYEMARIEELDDQTLIQIIKNPEIPVKRSKPKRTQITIISFFLGIIIGSLICFLLYLAPNILKVLSNEKGTRKLSNLS